MSSLAINITFWISVLVLLICGSYLYQKMTEKADTVSDKRKLIAAMSQDAVIIGIIILMGFVPSLGYISVVPGVISLTLVHIPVLLGASLFGAKRGFVYGLTFGITSWIQATMSPTGLNLFFVYPWISVLPRVIFGFLAGLVFELLNKKTTICRKSLVMALIYFLLTALHTGLVFATLFIFYGGELMALANGFAGALAFGLTLGFFAIIAIGALGEALVSALVLPPLSKALSRSYLKRR